MSASFNYPLFQTRYPELASVSQATAQEYFADATDILDNTPQSPVQNLDTRLRLLNMLVAHYAALAAATASGSDFAGPVSSASEGSVSVSSMVKIPSGAEFYWTTPYGRQFWQATIALRSAIYVAAPTRRAIRWP